MHATTTHADPVAPSRRDVLKAGAALAAAALLPLSGASAAVAPRRDRQRVLRIAHLTDLHIQPERRAAKGMAACLRHIAVQPDGPGLVLTGGDLIMDALEAGPDRVRAQWHLFHRTLADECDLPVEHCLGNHDVWGWSRSRSGATGNEPNYGKRWALDELALESSYRAFDRAGWRFIVLDSIHPAGEGYIGRLGPEQFAWLRDQLAATPETTPVLVVSHIPIFSATVLVDEPRQGVRRVPSSLMHDDSGAIRELFARHPNVKLCLSGHTHRVDRVDYRGVTYLCNGAVCGAWWKGPHYECREGYGLVDLFDDGSFEHRYVEYGWEAAE